MIWTLFILPFLNISEIFLHPFTASVIQDDWYIYQYQFTYYVTIIYPISLAINFQLGSDPLILILFRIQCFSDQIHMQPFIWR